MGVKVSKDSEIEDKEIKKLYAHPPGHRIDMNLKRAFFCLSCFFGLRPPLLTFKNDAMCLIHANHKQKLKVTGLQLDIQVFDYSSMILCWKYKSMVFEMYSEYMYYNYCLVQNWNTRENWMTRISRGATVLQLSCYFTPYWNTTFHNHYALIFVLYFFASIHVLDRSVHVSCIFG